MSMTLATLCLNEMEWLPKLYEQHRSWPKLVRWVFVEAADRVYAQASPDMVTQDGLSVDGTSDWLRELAARDPLVTYIPHGFTGHERPDQGKCAARNRYIEAAEGDCLFVLDADEFYTRLDQKRIGNILRYGYGKFWSYCFPHWHPWRPPSIADRPLFNLGVQGGLWDIGFIRGWALLPGAAYRANHNHLSTAEGQNMNERMHDFRRTGGAPACVHMGFTASLKTRQAKHRYYEARGEGQGDNRDEHVICRAAFETWQPGDTLPCGAYVEKYQGPVPECFQ